jgi:4-hydroxy-3-methylbut-2-enyl diphosphate reductase
MDPDKHLHVHNTICRQVSDRETSLKEFARNHDIIIFVSGKDSSNGKVLYSISKAINPDTYFISSPDEMEKSWFKGKGSAGICGATSTPKWLIEKVYDVVSAI